MPSDQVMHKFKAGALRSGGSSGPTVRNRKQAIAIMLSEQRKEDENGGHYPEPKRKSMADDKKKKDWIAGAIKHPGSLRAAAKRKGRSTRQEAEEEANSSNKKIRSRGNLAKTLMGMH